MIKFIILVIIGYYKRKNASNRGPITGSTTPWYIEPPQTVGQCVLSDPDLETARGHGHGRGDARAAAE